MKFALIGFAVATATWIAAPHARHSRVAVTVQQQGTNWSWHGRISSSGVLDVRTITGSVSTEAASGAEAEVVAIKHAGHHGDPADVHVLAEERDGGVRICVIYPGSRDSDGCDNGDHHRGHWDDEDRNDTRVDFEVKLPAGAAFHGASVNGDVEVRGATGPVEARAVNGSVELETTAGEAEGESVNGSVRAVVRGQGHESLRFTSVNGLVDVTVPANLDADLEASTVNGSINSDFPITISGGTMMRRQRLEGVIGHGGRRLTMTSVNGAIRLRKIS
ncbi:MAG TPA: DUF4097 family beta strand repeat-containing protein [Gemmatimonadales bacterium]|jgi:hypothetical protein